MTKTLEEASKHDCRREVADISGALWFDDHGNGPSEPTITVRAAVYVENARVEMQSNGIGGYLMDPLTARKVGAALIKAATDSEHYAKGGVP